MNREFDQSCPHNYNPAHENAHTCTCTHVVLWLCRAYWEWILIFLCSQLCLISILHTTICAGLYCSAECQTLFFSSSSRGAAFLSLTGEGVNLLGQKYLKSLWKRSEIRGSGPVSNRAASFCTYRFYDVMYQNNTVWNTIQQCNPLDLTLPLFWSTQ